MASNTSPGEGLHPIQVVSRRTGLTPDVLRAWERRYQAVSPTRSPGSRRFYTDEDVERLHLLRRATSGGRSIGQVAGLKTEELRQLVEQDDQAVRSVPAPELPEMARPEIGDDVTRHFTESFEAVQAYDVDRLETALGRASVSLSPMVVIDSVLVPLMHRIGEYWEAGSLRVAQEHLASAVVRTFLGNMARTGRPDPNAPVMIVSTPVGQVHELGGLIAVATASSMGWRVYYLGPSLPAEEIAAAVTRTNASLVGLGLCYPAGDPAVVEEVRRLRRLVGDKTRILLGGAAAVSYAKAIRDPGVQVIADMVEFRDVLRKSGDRPSATEPEVSR